VGHEVLARSTQIESGRKNGRTKFGTALNLARVTGATLVITKLNRLPRKGQSGEGLCNLQAWNSQSVKQGMFRYPPFGKERWLNRRQIPNQLEVLPSLDAPIFKVVSETSFGLSDLTIRNRWAKTRVEMDDEGRSIKAMSAASRSRRKCSMVMGFMSCVWNIGLTFQGSLLRE